MKDFLKEFFKFLLKFCTDVNEPYAPKFSRFELDLIESITINQ